MEKPQPELPKSADEAPFSFPPHRKSRLKSETYRVLVRILSGFYGQPHLCQPPQFPSLEPRPANDSNEPAQASETEVHERVDLIGPDSMDHIKSPTQNGAIIDENLEAIGSQETEFCDTQVMIDDIESLMRIEEDENLLKQDPMVTNSIIGTGLHNEEFGQLQQLLIDELELVIKGNDEPVLDENCDRVTKSLDDKQNGGIVALLNDQEQPCNPQPVILKEYSSVGERESDERSYGQSVSEPFCSSSNENMANQVSKPSNCNEDKSPKFRENELIINHEIHQKDMAPDIYITEDGEIEEGELPTEFKVDGKSVDIFTEDAVMSEKKIDEQVSETLSGESMIPFIGIDEATRNIGALMMDTVDNAKNGIQVEAKESVRTDLTCKRKVVVYGDPILADEPDQNKEKKRRVARKEKQSSGINERKKGIGNVEEKKGSVVKHGIGCPATSPHDLAICTEKKDQNAPGNLGIMVEKQENAGSHGKKKRGPPSKEKKAKKKQRERKKRAEKNRELGVKRLKLRPVVKPKPVNYCRHFIHGRCQEGEKCKFSHDTIPVTKSKPCCHFARHSCMKGDNCPFDHQLSNYPCTSYVSKGCCSRGDDCLFSHKIAPKEDVPSASNVCTLQLKSPSLPVTSTSNEQLGNSGSSRQTDKSMSNSMGIITSESREKNVTKRELNLPALTPKGISFLSSEKSPAVCSSHPKLGSLSPKRNERVTAGNPTDQSAARTSQNSHEVSKGSTAAKAPKGINFLSFGKAPSEHPSVKKQISLPADQQEGVKFSPSNKLHVRQQPSASQIMDSGMEVGKDASPIVSSMLGRLNQMPRQKELSSFPSSGEASTGGLIINTMVDTSVQASKTSSDNDPTNSSASPRKLGASPLGSGQSSNLLANMLMKNTPNSSAQKALMSTLAFAAKVESEMKRNRSANGFPSINTGASSSSSSSYGDSKSDSAKASKILDFLSGVGKTKQ